MPVSPPRPCRAVGCAALVYSKDGYCDAHGRAAYQQQNKAAGEDRKESNRFYQRAAWKKLRRSHIEREPSCRKCGAAGAVVDHIVPRSIRPDLELELSNMQTLCHSCHSQKTRREEKRGGGRWQGG